MGSSIPHVQFIVTFCTPNSFVTKLNSHVCCIPFFINVDVEVSESSFQRFWGIFFLQIGLPRVSCSCDKRKMQTMQILIK